MSEKTKSIIVNAIGFLITFSIVVSIFILYDSSKGTNIYNRIYFKVLDMDYFDDKTFIGSFDFDIKENEVKEVFKTYIEFKEYYVVLNNYADGGTLKYIIQINDKDGIEEVNESLMSDYICAYEIRNDVSFKLIIDNSNKFGIQKGTLNIYASNENDEI